MSLKRITITHKDIENSKITDVLNKVMPLNFYDRDNVGSKIIDLSFRISKPLNYHLKTNGKLYESINESPITIKFQSVLLKEGNNILHFFIKGVQDRIRVFNINYSFKYSVYYGRHDPITHEPFNSKHEVVRCCDCMEYSLKSSWYRENQKKCPFSYLKNCSCNNESGKFYTLTDAMFYKKIVKNGGKFVRKPL